MTLSTANLHVSGGQQGLLPRERAAMGFACGRRRPLSAMARDATEFSERVRNRRMRSEGLLLHVTQAGFS